MATCILELTFEPPTPTAGVFIDLKNDLDTVDHDILQKVQYYGVRWLLRDWF